MPKYADTKLQVEDNKLTYFHGGFGIEPVYELFAADTNKIGYQKRFLVERFLVYKKLLASQAFPMLITEDFFVEGILYYFFKAKPNESSVFLPASYKSLFETLLTRDLLSKRHITWYENLQDVLAGALQKEKEIHFLCQLKPKTDIRTFLDFIAIRRGSLLMVLDYASNADKNECLYARKHGIQLLEHADGSADFFS